MNDETTKELEDLSTLACSTDEGQRRRALVAMLARVVGRASQVDTLPVDEAARIGVLEANLREVTQQRDRAVQEVRDFNALVGRVWDEVPSDVATRTNSTGLAEAVHALTESRSVLKALAESRREAVQQVERERDHWHQKWNTAQNNAETLARDLAEARAEVERPSARLPLEVMLQCLGGVLNDMTRGGDLEKAEARSFHDVACVRLRSLAGSPEKAGRVLTSEEVEAAAEAMYQAPTYKKALRWLESEGYLSVRLPSDG